MADYQNIFDANVATLQQAPGSRSPHPSLLEAAKRCYKRGTSHIVIIVATREEQVIIVIIVVTIFFHTNSKVIDYDIIELLFLTSMRGTCRESGRPCLGTACK